MAGMLSRAAGVYWASGDPGEADGVRAEVWNAGITLSACG